MDHLDLLGLQPADREGCLELIGGSAEPDVEDALGLLRNRLGSMALNESLPDHTEQVWLKALLRFVPELVSWYRDRQIPQTIVEETLADWGRHFALNRRVRGDFGCETWRWLVVHAQGTMFQLGRLQFMLYQPGKALPGHEQEYAFGVHIPETGEPLSVEAVDASLAQALGFFPIHFPEVHAKFATCHSWMLDPGLRSELPDTSNVARFADRFTLLGQQGDDPTDALYFVFRTRDTGALKSLPRVSSIQRAVLDRYDAGTPVLGTAGYLTLPDVS